MLATQDGFNAFLIKINLACQICQLSVLFLFEKVRDLNKHHKCNSQNILVHSP